MLTTDCVLQIATKHLHIENIFVIIKLQTELKSVVLRVKDLTIEKALLPNFNHWGGAFYLYHIIYQFDQQDNKNVVLFVFF